jgi:Protein of unknown function (DUF3987)
MVKRVLSKNWILSYNEAINQISEAPSHYNIWAAIAVVSAVLKDHVYFSRGIYTINPNQYIILVGPPGVGKGTAIHPAFAFPLRLKLINMLTDRVTAPKIIERLAEGWATLPMPPILKTSPNGTGPPTMATQALKEAAAIIRSTELQTFLGSSDWMSQFLCDAWDRRDFEYDTKNKGTNVISGMCLSLIGACVPGFIQSLSKEQASVINGGFTARSVFVYANEKARSIEWPKSFNQIPGGIDIQQKLEDDLMAISQLRGEFTITDAAKSVFSNFYRSEAVRPTNTDSDVMAHFKSRAHVHVFKVAMALSASNSDSLVIDYIDMQVAVTLVKQVAANLDRAFRGSGSNVLGEVTAKIQQFIEAKGVTTRKEILKHNHFDISSEDLNRVLYLLEEIDFITITVQGGQSIIKFSNKQGKGIVSSKISDLTGGGSGTGI